ncbi:MAG: hypothetical protein HY077_17205 [Elusimicrobia bacterium]|nr:hypothetical protein [Elusimicrobiota bacterium]
MKRLLCATALLWLAAPARATPNFTTKEGKPTLNAGVNFSSAVLVSMTGAYTDAGGGARAFYIRGSSQGAISFSVSSAVFSARTADGLAFTDESGVRVSSVTQPLVEIAISSITGATVIGGLPGGAAPGGYRMLYSVIGTTGSYRLFTATSSDGINWGNQYSTAVITSLNGGLSFLGSPSMVRLNSGDLRLYFAQSPGAGNPPAVRQIYSSLSTSNGASWSAPASVFAGPVNEVAAVKRTDGRVRLYYTSPLAAQTTSVQVLSALCSDVNGATFVAEAGVRLSTGAGLGNLSNLEVVRTTEVPVGFRWRVYYNFTPFVPVGVSTADVFAAVTDAPDITSLSPGSVFRSAPPIQFLIQGEIFDPAMTAALALAGQANIPGTALVHTDDQNLTATFDTQNKALGQWDTVVTNANTLSATLPLSLLIDFEGGSVNLTDNLMRPLTGGKTKIVVNTYLEGPISVKLYTTTGRNLATIFDGYVVAGAHTFFWNGSTASGRTVASGVYLLKITGPKLDTVNKIVVIK